MKTPKKLIFYTIKIICSIVGSFLILFGGCILVVPLIGSDMQLFPLSLIIGIPVVALGVHILFYPKKLQEKNSKKDMPAKETDSIFDENNKFIGKADGTELSDGDIPELINTTYEHKTEHEWKFLMNKKWYLQTWFICILFAFWPLVIPVIIGIVFLILQIIETRKVTKKYGEANDIDKNIDELKNNYQKQKEYLNKKKEQEQENLNALIAQKDTMQKELEQYETEVLCKQFDFSDYSGLTSEDCKNKLALLKLSEKESLKNQEFINITSDESKKVINDNIKQLLRCFNAECDNILLNISVKNIDSMRNKVTKAFETLNKIFSVDGVQLDKKALELKLEELNLVYSYEIIHMQEVENQKAIKAQMLEEEKIRREIESKKKKLEKDEKQFSNEISKMMKYLQKTTNDVEKELYLEKIKELENKLQKLTGEKEVLLEREANAKAGFVYVISNIGSFGENIFKIGMTRRLEPLDRIKELSSASVPFEFDVHAMIFSEDAPSLEAALHKKFQNKSVNRVNLRKEFFRVSLDEIEDEINNNYDKTVEFTRIPVATEYRQTLGILKEENQLQLI